MDEFSKKEVDKLIHSLALKNNMRDEDLKNLVNSQFEFANIKIKELNRLENIETEEDLENTKTNFIFTSFFRLFVPYYRIRARNNRRDNINEKINNKWKKK